LRFNQTRASRWLWLAGAFLLYAVLTRPLEGSLLLPGEVLLLLSPGWRTNLLPAATAVGVWVGAVAVTLAVNTVRFGSPYNTGYADSQLQWTTPIWVGLPGDLFSPGRGVVWEFPAIALAVVGAVHLWRTGRRAVVLCFAGLSALLLVEASLYVDWVGGWGWGFRFIQPALPVLAVLAGAGTTALPKAIRGSAPAVVLALGIAWNVPVVATDLLGGYGQTYANAAANWRLDAYPPIGAWRFLHRVFPANGLDSGALDIVWFRATKFVGAIAVVPFIVLAGLAITAWVSVVRAERRSA